MKKRKAYKSSIEVVRAALPASVPPSAAAAAASALLGAPAHLLELEATDVVGQVLALRLGVLVVLRHLLDDGLRLPQAVCQLVDAVGEVRPDLAVVAFHDFQGEVGELLKGGGLDDLEVAAGGALGEPTRRTGEGRVES